MITNQENNLSNLETLWNKGVAPLKKEFILAGNLEKSEKKIELNDDDDENKRKSQECSSKKNGKRLRGQNKNRRNLMNQEKLKNHPKENMCFSFCGDGQCELGDDCKRSHDLDSYAETRSEDIGNHCHNFSTFGKCKYGIVCRFGGCHLRDGKYNIIDEERFSKTNQSHFKNGLDKNVQFRLRKKLYDFTRANEISKKVHSENFSMSDAVCEPRLISLKKKIDFTNKLYLAPLTTVGNLPFRRVCKEFGADITCGEMALSSNLLEGSTSEWALLRRHDSEKVFGVQLCGSNADQLGRCAQLICQECDVDFIDLNMGCPIDLVYKRGAGSALMERKKKLDEIIYNVTSVSNVPLTLKMRTGVHQNKNIAESVLESVKKWQNDRIGLVTIHGRSREQRYTKSADWDYIRECAEESKKEVDRSCSFSIFGSGDILSWEEYYEKLEQANVDGIMIARGALIKPWIFTEIREKRTWDISAQERLDILKKYTNYGLENWGSDNDGVERTRRFLLEWLSFLHRYIPVGLLERLPQKINDRPPRYLGRNDLETLMSSSSCRDWISISEMLLGKIPSGFTFIPKHKANSY